MHKQYDYLQSIFNQKLFTKEFKMRSSKARVSVMKNLQNKGCGAQRFESDVRTFK
jgi:hypothetical protein